MARMPLVAKQEVVLQLHDIHERRDLGADEERLIEIQHLVDELISEAALLLEDVLL